MIASPPVSVIPYIVVKRKNLKNLILVNIEINVLKPKYSWFAIPTVSDGQDIYCQFKGTVR
jgi:hypothetical protein